MKLSFLILLFPILISGQTVFDTIINANFQSKYISEILDDIRNKNQISIFFIAEDLPTEQISIKFENEALQKVLDTLLFETRLVAIEYRSNVIILPRKIIEEQYSPLYYEQLSNAPLNNLLLFGTEMMVGERKNLSPTGRGLVNGKVLAKELNEPITGATIYFSELKLGSATDEDGHFTIELPIGQHQMVVQYLGYDDYSCILNVFNDGFIEFSLEKNAVQLDEVVVTGKAADFNIQNAQIGLAKLDITSIKKLPTFLGETDLLKGLLLQPGVSSVGEGAIGFNVRGGNADQNLVLQNGALIFNTSHALGFFSAFNTDLIKSVSLYKANMPAQFGGRLSSVLDVELRDGDFQKHKIKASISPITSKLILEGPIIKNKSSLIGGFRTTYSNWVLNFINVPEVQNSKVFFYDANLNYTHRFNEKNSIRFSSYFAQDRFAFNEDFGFDYSTNSLNFLFKKIISEKLFSNFTIGRDNYASKSLELEKETASALEIEVSNYKLKEELTYFVNEDLKIISGVSAIYYSISPGELRSTSPTSLTIPVILARDYGLESAVFLNSDWSISTRWSISGGLRYNLYHKFGPATVYDYENPTTPSLVTVSGQTTFEKASIVAHYQGLEPRFSGRYSVSKQSALKFGYSRTSQYLNQIFNANTSTPSSLWKLSDTYLKPKRSHNYSLGYFHNFQNNLWETSIEGFFRDISEVVDYVDFANLTVNDQIETELLSGIGKSYGLELSVKKSKGKYYGWLSYTLSKSQQKIDGINDGEWYLSNLDKRHELSLLLNYQPNQRNTFTVNFIYASGRPTTAPIGSYQERKGVIVPIYSERNKLNIPDYHRMDFSYTKGKGYRSDRKFKTSWTFSLYNAYSRRNAFSVFYQQEPFKNPKAFQLSILGSAFPSITFNIESI